MKPSRFPEGQGQEGPAGLTVSPDLHQNRETWGVSAAGNKRTPDFIQKHKDEEEERRGLRDTPRSLVSEHPPSPDRGVRTAPGAGPAHAGRPVLGHTATANPRGNHYLVNRRCRDATLTSRSQQGFIQREERSRGRGRTAKLPEGSADENLAGLKSGRDLPNSTRKDGRENHTLDIIKNVFFFFFELLFERHCQKIADTYH